MVMMNFLKIYPDQSSPYIFFRASSVKSSEDHRVLAEKVAKPGEDRFG